MDDARPADPALACDPVTLEIVRGALRAAQSRDGSADRAHGDVALHPREEGFLRRLSSTVGQAGRRLAAAGLRRHHRPGARAVFPPPRCGPATSTGTTTATAAKGGVSHTPDQVFARRSSSTAKLVAFTQAWAHFNDVGGSGPGSLSPECDRHLPGGHDRAAGAALARGRAQRGGDADLRAQLALPDDHAAICAPRSPPRAARRKRMLELFGRFGNVRARWLRQLIERSGAAIMREALPRPGARRELRLHRHGRDRRPGQRADQDALHARGDANAHRARHDAQRRPVPGSGQLPDGEGGAAA
jgi:N-methylhydantoinase B